MSRSRNLWTNPERLMQGVALAQEQGFAFVKDAVMGWGLSNLAAEIAPLPLTLTDKILPANDGSDRVVTQRFERAYYAVGDDKVPTATFVAGALATRIRGLRRRFPELSDWAATEVGYQLYKSNQEAHISAHRDRASDELLSVAITIAGRANIGIYKSVFDRNQERLGLITREIAEPGTVMFLRASGFGSGERVLHDVGSPLDDIRTVLNLRMRPDVLDETA